MAPMNDGIVMMTDGIVMITDGIATMTDVIVTMTDGIVTVPIHVFYDELWLTPTAYSILHSPCNQVM